MDIEGVRQLGEYVYLLTPGWILALSGGLVLLGLTGGIYAVYQMLKAKREEAVEEPAEVSSCDYCNGFRRRELPYASWEHFMADVRNINICLEHIIDRCPNVLEKPSPVEILDRRIEARVDEERRRAYKGGINPCPPCRRIL